MHPDRRGKSKWVKLTPWYYTKKRKRSRSAERRDAINADRSGTEGPRIKA